MERWRKSSPIEFSVNLLLQAHKVSGDSPHSILDRFRLDAVRDGIFANFSPRPNHFAADNRHNRAGFA